ncbi:MAG: nitrogen fixation protein NifB [Clostridiales bacterium]|nr:nitrogen fixation protein NifB [Clostridiales bacterium]
MSEAISRKEFYREVELGERIGNDGIDFGEGVLESLDFENKVQEQIRACFDMNHESYVKNRLPSGVRLPSNYRLGVPYRNGAPFHIELEGGRYLLYDKKNFLYEVTFIEKPAFYNKKTSDGVNMSTIANEIGKTKISVAYSNECALRDKGLDCKFCNINATKDRFAQLQGIEWKNPKQIAETVKEAYAEGYQRITITGGFIPERREVEYYIDVAEEIRDLTGLDDFGGTACVGAPADLSVIEKYKEAGYSAISSNMEIWDENIFKTICPGKDQICGGRQNWIEALKEEVRVFGKGNVRSFFVAGIEPKSTLLEGIEYLASLGVVAIPLHWLPNPGSELEGHRAPKAEWYTDLYQKTYNILKKNGLTHLDLYRSANVENSIFDYLYDMDGDLLPFERHNADAVQFLPAV